VPAAEADDRDRDGAQRAGRRDPHRVQHAAEHDRSADLGHEGWEMGNTVHFRHFGC
jgi:hypothetical protein